LQILKMLPFLFSDSNLSKERDDAEKIAKELERTDKWKKMYKNWDKSFDGDHPSVSL